MKSIAFVCLAAVGTIAHLRAGPIEHAIIAAMQLSERPNYSWSTTIEDHGGTHGIEGKTDGKGCTWVRMPMVGSVARALGRDGDMPLEVYFRGKHVAAVRTGDSWKTLAELSGSRESRTAERKLPLVRGSANAGNFGGRSGAVGGAVPFLDDPSGRGHRGGQVGVSHPHEELAIIVSCAQGMETNGEIVTGALSETGAALLFVRDDQGAVAPLSATGGFKLWLRHGAVVKYQLRLDAVLAVNRRRIEAHRTVHTILIDMGSTRLAVPVDVRAILDR